MSKMKDLFYDIEQAFLDGDTPERIAEALNIPLQMVQDALDTMGVEPDYDDSMDGDFDSAMASAGWGTDEDYGSY
mgnify:CR=1 FL=1